MDIEEHGMGHEADAEKGKNGPPKRGVEIKGPQTSVAPLPQFRGLKRTLDATTGREKKRTKKQQRNKIEYTLD